ncbi:hypothetical protein NFHSH190041_18420 [Shewanella sp. NFH-SH190041]|nr:hypothetical protein NFHSH190041_18420 [Shewanella sp. NFH-SH190041]
MALLDIWLLYTGIIERSIFDIIAGCILIISSAGMFFAMRSGSFFQEELGKWGKKRSDKKADKL